MEWRLRRVVPAAAVTTHAKPHAQQQLARDLEVERAAMGQRSRLQSSGPGLLCAAARFGFAVLKNNLSLLEGLDFTPAASATTKITMKTFLLSGQSDIWVPVQQYNHEWRRRRVVPAAEVTIHAKPHAQQQLARDLEVERAAMGQRCRPQRFGEVKRGNPQPRRWLVFL